MHLLTKYQTIIILFCNTKLVSNCNQHKGVNICHCTFSLDDLIQHLFFYVMNAKKYYLLCRVKMNRSVCIYMPLINANVIFLIFNSDENASYADTIDTIN